MPLTVLDHALATHLITRLRDKATQPEQFRPLARALTGILIAEATRTMPLQKHVVQTPLEVVEGEQLACPVVIAPVLRAGLSMLDEALEMIPEARVGYLGLERDEQTAIARAYYCKLPPMQGSYALLLDPMLATGGSAARAAFDLYGAGAAHVCLLSMVAAPEGVSHLEVLYPEMQVVAAALDRELNASSYILPGLGDFGDRLYGTF